ncbi:hypothetical protein, partial [Proteus mirabilis]|uniref:hypothetical protein n=1 Tax=Proteus mirabilis TaxID=584 RepID=UPI00335775AD
TVALGTDCDEPFERPAASQRSLITTLRCLIWYSSMSIMAMSDASILFRTPPKELMVLSLITALMFQSPKKKRGINVLICPLMVLRVLI